MEINAKEQRKTKMKAHSLGLAHQVQEFSVAGSQFMGCCCHNLYMVVKWKHKFCLCQVAFWESHAPSRRQTARNTRGPRLCARVLLLTPTSRLELQKMSLSSRTLQASLVRSTLECMMWRWCCKKTLIYYTFIDPNNFLPYLLLKIHSVKFLGDFL